MFRNQRFPLSIGSDTTLIKRIQDFNSKTRTQNRDQHRLKKLMSDPSSGESITYRKSTQIS